MIEDEYHIVWTPSCASYGVSYILSKNNKLYHEVYSESLEFLRNTQLSLEEEILNYAKSLQDNAWLEPYTFKTKRNIMRELPSFEELNKRGVYVGY